MSYLLVPKMQKKLGVTVFVSELKRVVNYTERTSKIVKSSQSSSNGHLPYHLFIL